MVRACRPWVVLLVFAALAGCGSDATPSRPLRFNGLSNDVKVVIDDRGVPHIYADDDADLFYAAGYQMAKDRLFEMDLVRRRALGRQSEVLGASKLGEDKLIRRLNLPRWGRADLERIRREAPELALFYDAWVAGVNARIDEVLAGTAPLPYGFGPGELDYAPERWTVEEAAAIPKLLLFGLQSGIEFKVLATILQQQAPEFLSRIELLEPMYPTFILPPSERPGADKLASTVGEEHVAAAPLVSRGASELSPAAVAALERLFALEGGLSARGSNNWAVEGRFTDNGRPLLANDPHQPLGSPSLMYTQHLNSKHRHGTIDAEGFSFVGAPLIHLGHNDRIAWAATSCFADMMDIWAVQTVAGDDGELRVRLGNALYPITRRDESFTVRRFDDDGRPLPLAPADTQTVTMESVPGRGVLLDLGSDVGIPDALVAPGRRLLLEWAGFKGTTESLTWLGFNRAKDLDDFDAALEHSQLAPFNWMAADANEIAYRVQLDVPDRGDLSTRPSPTTVMDGDDASTLWTGASLPYDELPHSFQPQRGFLLSANNDPFGFTADGDVTNDPWYYGSFFAPGFRAKRIEDELKRLTERGSVTVEDMEALQRDTHSLLADEMLPILAQAWDAVGAKPSLAQYDGRQDLDTLATLLDHWDRRMTVDSPAALVFHLYSLYLTQGIVGDDLGGLYPLVLNANAPYVEKLAALALNGTYPGSEQVVGPDPELLALQALDETSAWLVEHYGSVDPSGYTWGAAHGTFFESAWSGDNDLTLGFVSTQGGDATVNPSGSKFFVGSSNKVVDRFDSHDGPIFRQVTSFGADGTPTMKVNWIIGNSGDPHDAHWDDSLQDWVDGTYRTLPFTRDEVDAAEESSYTLHAK